MRRLVLFVAVFVLCSGVIHAEVIFYLGPDQGSWHESSYWSSGRPRKQDDVRIFNNLTVQITKDVHIDQMTVGSTADGAVIQDDGYVRSDIFLGRDGGVGLGSYTLNSGSIQSYNIIVGGTNSTGNRPSGNNTFVMNGGTIDTQWVKVHAYQDGVNTFLVNDGELTVANTLIVGSRLFSETTVSAVFIQNGGTVSANWLAMGDMPIYNLRGGTLTLNTAISFGSWTDGYFDFAGGALNLPGVWDFDKLTSILYSEFRVFGDLAREGGLDFSDLSINDETFTQITAIPEPSTLIVFLGLGFACIGWSWWRRWLRKV